MDYTRSDPQLIARACQKPPRSSCAPTRCSATGGSGVDDLTGAGRKTTTVAMDFGRISFRSDLVLCLFGTPGLERFWFMWDELAYGAIGAVILADTRRVSDCFAAVDYFERSGTPFVVAVNCFEGAPVHDPADIRIALDLDAAAPVVLCDAPPGLGKARADRPHKACDQPAGSGLRSIAPSPYPVSSRPDLTALSGPRRCRPRRRGGPGPPVMRRRD
jgi:signal recognition particle receptor subunit beta